MTTFVLIHGAYQGGWIWKPVAEQLPKKDSEEQLTTEAQRHREHKKDEVL